MLGNPSYHVLSKMGFSQKSTLCLNKMKISQSSGNFIEIRNMRLKELNVLFKMSIGSSGRFAAVFLLEAIFDFFEFFHANTPHGDFF